MNHEFTIEEIKEAAKAARIHCPGFSQEQFESLIELEWRLEEKGYLRAVQGLINLEAEKGVSCVEALEACQELMQQKTELEKQVLDLEQKAEGLAAQTKQAKGEYDRIKAATAKAEQALAQVRDEYVSVEGKLVALNRRMDKEKQSIAKEIESCCRQAHVTKEEVAVAGQIKAEVESHGFTLELALELAGEFAGRKNASDELAEGLKEHGSLTNYLRELDEWGNKEKTRITSEIADLEARKESLDNYRQQLEGILSQLQADITNEKEMRRFYNRYHGVSPLMDHLEGWGQLYFIRCNNPAFALTGAFNHNLGNAHFWTNKPPAMCPHCGYRHLLYDEKIYQAINWPVGTPLKITLGEYNG